MATPEADRAQAVAALVEPGAERIALAARLTELDGTLSPLVQAAVTAGVPQRRISALTGLSRNTIIRWSAGSS